MTLSEIELWIILDVLVLLLIGMGPKVALVPFMEMTAGLEKDTRKKVATKMVKIATTWALILVLLGAVFMKLFHFSEEALYIAGGIVFLLLALNMVTSGAKEKDHEKMTEKEAESKAAYPLAVPYLLNPVGITVLIVFSAAGNSLTVDLLLAILILIIALFDWFVFSHLDKLMKHLDKSKMAVTEAIFGVILAALAIELIWRGLVDLGVIEGVIY